MIEKGYSMKIWKKYQGLLQRYGLNLLSVLMFWGGMIRKSFNCDTLGHMLSEDADIMIRIRGGRYVVALGDFLLLKLGLRTTSNISITMTITFLFLALTMMVIQDIFASWMPDTWLGKAGFFCGLNLIFLNVLFAELLMFSEYSIYFAIAYFTASLGVRCYAKRKYLLMLLMYAVAVCTYQNAVVFAAIVTAFYICLSEKLKLTRRAVVREAAGISVCMGMGVLNYLCLWTLDRLGIVPTIKEAASGNWGHRLTEAVRHYISLNRNCAGVIPSLWLPLLFIAAVWILIVYSCMKEHKMSECLFLFVVWLGCNALLYVIPTIQGTAYFPPRLMFCFFGVQGFMLVSAYAVCMDSLHGVLTWGGCLYLVVHLLFSDFIVTNHFISNTLDRVYANMLYEEILKYEEETGNHVTKLAVMHDIDSAFYYHDFSFATDQINERALPTVPISLIYAVTGREFEKLEVPEIVSQQYFDNKNWDYFNLNEQLIIEGDTAYWCIF